MSMQPHAPTVPEPARRSAPGARRLRALALALALLAPASCGQKIAPAPDPAFTVQGDQIDLKPGAPQPARFSTEAAVRAAPLQSPVIPARVTTVEALTAPSFAPLDGRVVEVRVRLGDHVKQGDRLVLVRTADLPSLQHELSAASLAVKTREANVDRVRKLVESRAGSQNELIVAESELAEAKLSVHAASSRLQSLSVAQQGDNAYWVLANRAGTVTQLDATPGKQVGPDKDKPVATIADLDEVLVVGDVAQRDAAALLPGLGADITLPGSTEAPIRGVIETVSEVVDPDRQAVPVRVRVKNDRRTLRPNSYVDLTFAPPSDKQVVQVPAAAVVRDGMKAVVFVETAPGSFRRRPVDIGRQTEDRVEIVSGLNEGERVVVTGALLLLNSLDVEG